MQATQASNEVYDFVMDVAAGQRSVPEIAEGLHRIIGQLLHFIAEPWSSIGVTAGEACGDPVSGRYGPKIGARSAGTPGRKVVFGPAPPV